MLNIMIIANAVQTVEETLDAFRFYSDNKALLERNNAIYLDKYLRMLPKIGGRRREIVDAANYCRRQSGRLAPLSEHNSYALNGIHLYNYLATRGKHWRIELIDNLDLEPRQAQSLAEWADVAIFSTTFITSAFTITRVSNVLKGWNPRLKVIVGGAKLTQFASEQELHEAAQSCDGMILSRTGERTLYSVLDHIDRDEPFQHLSNIAYWRDEFRQSPMNHDDGADIDDSRVRWDLLPGGYLKTAVNIRTGRGCPFKCKFCTFPGYNDQRTDLKQVETVLTELSEIAKRPQIRSVRFVDDTLFLNKKHLIEVCRAIIASGFDLPWTCYLRATTLTDECCRYLRDAGCRLVLLGVESADDHVLRNMSKGTTEAQNWTAAGNLAKYGIFCFSFILVGFPGETERTVEKVIDFLNNSGTHGYVHSPMFVFPKSPISTEAAKFNLRGGFNDWSHDTMDAVTAIGACEHIFESVTGSAYIDRGSSICKVLLDHGYSVGDVKRLGQLHNDIARRQNAGLASANRIKQFSRMAAAAHCDVTGAHHEASSPYSRTQDEARVNAGARF
jgi:anaerobic magnesium-protoporphyrin IX monomethyl ester cyclase